MKTIALLYTCYIERFEVPVCGQYFITFFLHFSQSDSRNFVFGTRRCFQKTKKTESGYSCIFQALEQYVIPHLRTYWTQLQQVLDDNSQSNALLQEEAYQVYGALLVCQALVLLLIQQKKMYFLEQPLVYIGAKKSEEKLSMVQIQV